jgi:hypothetical protein
MFGNIFNKIMSYFPAVTISYTAQNEPVTKVTPVTPKTKKDAQEIRYNNMTKKQLVALAAEQGIDLKMKMTKAAMIDVLTKS